MVLPGPPGGRVRRRRPIIPDARFDLQRSERAFGVSAFPRGPNSPEPETQAVPRVPPTAARGGAEKSGAAEEPQRMFSAAPLSSAAPRDPLTDSARAL